MNQPTFTPFPVLHTERLMLRKLTLSDKGDLLSMLSNAENGKYIDRKPITKKAELIEFIQFRNSGMDKNEWVYWAIVLKERNKLIGTICLWNFSDNYETTEIGYELNEAFQKKGFMDEAAKCVIKYASNELKIRILEAYTHVENKGSIKLLEKNNFKLIKTFKEKYKIKEGEYSMAVYHLKLN